MSLEKIDYELPQEIKNRISIKNIKDGIGHDLAGLYCDIYIDKKKVGYLNDDGYGGETDLEITEEANKVFEELLVKHNFNKYMFENGWDFYENKEEISFNSQKEHVVTSLYNLKQKEKEQKKLIKLFQTHVVYGDINRQKLYGWKGSTLRQMIDRFGVDNIQAMIDKSIKPELKKGKTILNTNFEELGLIK